MYYSRYIERTIERALKSSGGVLVTGPKFCGKTTTCMRFQKSFIKLNTNRVISLIAMDPKQALSGDSPHLIDDWQKVPDVWNYAKEDLDDDSKLEDIAFLICRGGWPVSLVQDREQALDITRNYYNSLFIIEESENERFRNKKPEVLKMILRSYARAVSTEASLQTIVRDVRQSNERSMDEKTLSDYISALKDLFIIEDMEAWSPNIRSKTSIRSTSTRHFVDTSIACRALQIGPEDLMNDLNRLGLFFEDMAVRDLRVYTSLIGGEVRHYRDNTGLECDAVIHLENGKWAAVEIKLGGDKLIDEGAASLIRLKKKKQKKVMSWPLYS